MYKKVQSILHKDSCTPLCNNLAAYIDVKRNVGHYAVISRNIVTVTSCPLAGGSAAKPVNRPYILRDANAQRLSHILQVSLVGGTVYTKNCTACSCVCLNLN